MKAILVLAVLALVAAAWFRPDLLHRLVPIGPGPHGPGPAAQSGGPAPYSASPATAMQATGAQMNRLGAKAGSAMDRALGTIP